MKILMSYNKNEGHGAIGRYVELVNYLLCNKNNIIYYISPYGFDRSQGDNFIHLGYKKRSIKPNFLYVWYIVCIVFLKNHSIMKKIDKCILFSGSSAFIFALMKNFYGYELIYSIRGNFVMHGGIDQSLYTKNIVKNYLVKIKLKFYALIERYILSQADKVVFQSEVNAKEYKIQYHVSDDKVYILYNNCNPSWVGKRREIPLKQGFNIGYIGNIFKAKGVGVVIDALSIVCSKNKNVYLTIIGDGPDREYYEKFVHKKNLEKNIFFLGNKNNASEIMINFDIVVVPSFMEAFPNVALEAIYHNIPVLGSDVGGIPVILDNEFLFEVGNYDELANKIIYLMDPLNYQNALIKTEKIRNKFLFDWGEEFNNIIFEKKDFYEKT